MEPLIDVYQRPGCALATDDLDAHVFEYLLGELLRILSEKGEGQMIFLSYDPRPLESLGSRNAVFTTTDPRNRYACMNGLRKSKNLRDACYRDFIVQESGPLFYTRAGRP